MEMLVVTSVYLFGGHSVHKACPVVFLYRPRPHASQVSPSAPGTDDVYPTLHLHKSYELLPAGDCALS
jgi:hypothetical protein